MAEASEAPRKRGRPAKAPGERRVTPLRNFRIDDELYVAAQAAAIERGEDLTAVVRGALAKYARDHERMKAMSARLRAKGSSSE